jgi:PKD repeat protein
MVKGCVVSMLAVAAVMTAGCTHQAASAPPLTGPSQLAMAVTMTANPDRISLDGGSQSLVTVQVRGPNGQVEVNVPLRVDILPNGALPAFDYGNLNTSNIVTGSDGNAFAIYTAPALAAGLNQPYSTVSIRAIIVGTDSAAAITHTVVISLVPIGVVLPPAQLPTPSFQFSPAAPGPKQTVSFDASASCGGTLSASGACPIGASRITNYSWSFGDLSSATGVTVTHGYSISGTFIVMLTVTNDRNQSASTTLSITVTASPPPTPTFNVSPSFVHENENILFTSTTIVPVGRTYSYDWDFGDGTPHGTGAVTTHLYGTPGPPIVLPVTYNGELTITDDLGQQGKAPMSVTVNP